MYFPWIFAAHLSLKEEMKSDDEYMQAMTSRMHAKFEKYWSKYSKILAIAMILDPRYKFNFVVWCYKKLYGDLGNFESYKINDDLFAIYEHYSNSSQ